MHNAISVRFLRVSEMTSAGEYTITLIKQKKLYQKSFFI